jgi:hypothetical protein
MSLFDFQSYDDLRLNHDCPPGQTWVQPQCIAAPCPGFCSPALPGNFDRPIPGFADFELCPQDTLWDAITQSCQPATAEQLADASRIPTSNPSIDALVGQAVGGNPVPAAGNLPDEASMDVPKLGALIIGAWLLFKYATRYNRE